MKNNIDDICVRMLITYAPAVAKVRGSPEEKVTRLTTALLNEDEAALDLFYS